MRRHLTSTILLATAAALVSLPYPFTARSWHLWLHIVGAVLFLGNIVVTAAWMLLAGRTQNQTILHFAAKAVLQADMLFTLPGVLLIAINGLVLAPAYGGGSVLGASWVQAALVLLIGSGGIWIVYLLPAQQQLITLSSGTVLEQGFWAAYRRWTIWGALATILPILSLLLMVFKPALW